MKIGLHVVDFSWPDAPKSIAPNLRGIATAAEDSGISHLSFMDHWFQMEWMAPATEPMLEGYTSLGFMAGLTSTTTLGLLVTGVTYRHPGLLAKTVATLDVLSGGRGELGIGAAWYDREHRGLGVPFPSTAERFERLEETLQICQQMWSDDDGPYKGKHYELAETICEPRPISQPRPPIMIGGSGERKTLRLVAQYANSCNLFEMGLEEVGHKLDVLQNHCKDLGRDYGTITKTMLTRADAFSDPDAFVESMRTYADIGIDVAIFVPTGDPVEFTKQLGAVGARLEDLSAPARPARGRRYAFAMPDPILDEQVRAVGLLDAQARAAELFRAVEEEGLLAPGVRDSEASDAVRDLAAARFGVAKHWHKRIIRSGPNTLQPYQEHPPDRVMTDDDIVFGDFGPIFDGWEGDFGRTWVLGNDPVKRRLRDDLPEVFAAGKDFFAARPDITGAQLFAEVVRLTEERGWEFGNFHCGHLVGEFPHENFAGEKIESVITTGSDLPMRRKDPSGRVGHWILEIHLVDRAREIGGFYEELLSL